jgi:NADPH:quinone reductase-like Zn-dependent oxidoreductase
MLAAGELRLKPHRSLPLAQAAEAHRLLETGQTRDKLVLTLG